MLSIRAGGLDAPRRDASMSPRHRSYQTLPTGRGTIATQQLSNPHPAMAEAQDRDCWTAQSAALSKTAQTRLCRVMTLLLPYWLMQGTQTEVDMKTKLHKGGPMDLNLYSADPPTSMPNEALLGCAPLLGKAPLYRTPAQSAGRRSSNAVQQPPRQYPPDPGSKLCRTGTHRSHGTT